MLDLVRNPEDRFSHNEAHVPDEESLPILREEVEAAVKTLKMGNSARVDNIPTALLKAGGDVMIDVLT